MLVGTTLLQPKQLAQELGFCTCATTSMQAACRHSATCCRPTLWQTCRASRGHEIGEERHDEHSIASFQWKFGEEREATDRDPDDVAGVLGQPMTWQGTAALGYNTAYRYARARKTYDTRVL